MGLGIPSVTASLWLADSFDEATKKGGTAAEKVAAEDDEKKNKDESFFRSVWESAKDSASTMASVRWGLVSGISCRFSAIRMLQPAAYNVPALTSPLQLVSRPFTALGRSAIRSILAEIRELRKVFAAAGVSVDAESGWLGVTVGTYVGVLGVGVGSFFHRAELLFFLPTSHLFAWQSPQTQQV